MIVQVLGDIHLEGNVYLLFIHRLHVTPTLVNTDAILSASQWRSFKHSDWLMSAGTRGGWKQWANNNFASTGRVALEKQASNQS